MAQDTQPAPHLMQCMEVWGGNQGVDSGIVMAGLDAWVFSRPFGGATEGGDVYYVSSCATGRITRLLVADVTGHGAAARNVASDLRYLMRRFVNYIDQTHFVREMNGKFVEMSQNGGFATAIVTTFFAPTNRLSLCNAGHPPPLHYQATKRRWTYLESESRDDPLPTNLPLGILDLSAYDQFEVKLKVGDLVLCYTDSLVESYDAEGIMLGQAGLLRLINEVLHDESATVIPKLLDRVAAINEKNLRQDDVTALLFRPNGLARTTPLKERLLAPFRIIKAVLGSIGRKKKPAPWPEMSLANVGGAVLTPLSQAGERGKMKNPKSE